MKGAAEEHSTGVETKRSPHPPTVILQETSLMRYMNSVVLIWCGCVCERRGKGEKKGRRVEGSQRGSKGKKKEKEGKGKVREEEASRRERRGEEEIRLLWRIKGDAFPSGCRSEFAIALESSFVQLPHVTFTKSSFIFVV